jgi:hypothetical protein
MYRIFTIEQNLITESVHYQCIYNLMNIKADVGNILSEMLDVC